MKDYLSIIGASAVSLVVGSINVWGVLLPYVASYYHSKDASFTVSTMGSVYGYIIILEGLGLATYMQIVDRIGCKFTAALGTALMSLAFFCGAVITDGRVFVALFALLFGYGMGIAILTVVNVLSKHFPNYKGRMSGICAGSYGLSQMFYTLVAGACCNPHNLYPVAEDTKSSSANFVYFDEEVYDRVPFTMLMLSVLSCGLGLIGLFLLSSPKMLKVVQPDEEEIEPLLEALRLPMPPPAPTYRELCATLRLRILFFQLFAGFSFSMWIIVCYKSFASTYIKDDDFLNKISIVASITNCIARFSFPTLMDYVDFRTLNFIVYPIQIVLCFSIYFTVSSPPIYLVVIGLTFVVNGALFYPTAVATNIIFGKHGAKAFGIIVWGSVIAALLPSVYFYVFVEHIGYLASFICCGILSILALILNYFLEMSPEYPEEAPFHGTNSKS